MNIFRYDGTLEGLFCVVFDAYSRKVFPEKLLTLEDIAPLFVTSEHVVITCEEHATRVFSGLTKKLSKEAIGNLMYAWISEIDGTDELLYKYICKVFSSKTIIFDNFSDPTILKIEKITQKVKKEAHLMQGFIRFQKTKENIFVAIIGPSHDVLPLIIPHFTNRFGKQKFAIFDEKRRYGFFKNNDGLHDMEINPSAITCHSLNKDLLDEGELLFEKTWKDYCKALSIKERHNSTLQRSLMPKKYWKYMVEAR